MAHRLRVRVIAVVFALLAASGINVRAEEVTCGFGRPEPEQTVYGAVNEGQQVGAGGVHRPERRR